MLLANDNFNPAAIISFKYNLGIILKQSHTRLACH